MQDLDTIVVRIMVSYASRTGDNNVDDFGYSMARLNDKVRPGTSAKLEYRSEQDHHICNFR